MWPTPIWLLVSAPTAAAVAPTDAAAPSPLAASPPRPPPTVPRNPPADCAKRALVASSPVDSPPARPVLSVWDAAELPPPVGLAPPSRPCTPPTADIPWRIAAPELVPGSTNASSLNSANGATVETRSSITAGTAVPIAADKDAECWVTTAVLSLAPTPITRAISGGVSAAAWVQRTLFQNQDWPTCETSPAAAIGAVAVRITRAAPRVSMTTRCPIAASTTKQPITPSTVARVPSLRSSTSTFPQGCHAAQVSTPSVARITALVSAEQAYTRAST